VVVADEVRQGGAVIECPWADSVAFALEQHLILEPEVESESPRRIPAVVTGPVATVDHVASSEVLTRLAGQGVTTVDMESFPLVATARGRPFVVVRVVVDTPDHPLVRPSTLRAGLTARKRLRAIGAVLRHWAAALEHV
jgi:4-hydroxy-3-methylbut-2-enyl diphosphate reductase